MIISILTFSFTYNPSKDLSGSGEKERTPIVEVSAPTVEREPKPTLAPESKPVSASALEPDPKAKVEKAVSNVSSAEVISVNGQFTVKPYSVQIELKGKENLTNKMTAKGMKLAIRDVLYQIKQLNIDFNNVGISMKYPLTDPYGNTEDQYVIKSDFSKATIDKLNGNKNSFNVDNLPAIATNWQEHDAIK